MVNEIVVDGIPYLPVVAPSSTKIVVLQRGWVVVGQWLQDGENITLENANIIRN